MTAYPSSNPIVQIKAELTGGNRITVNGRDAWALSELIAGGMIGVTPLENPAPRWSHYVFKLRRAGLAIETIDEKHGGPYAGLHARYVLKTPLTVIETVRARDKDRKAVAA
jgi:hypothetical protein